MRQRPLLIASIFVNVALAALYLAAKQRLTPANSTSGSAGSQSRSNAVKTVSVLRQQFFSWEQVESADYATYIKNLRDIGCPEQTIRDIVVADVNELYSKRRIQEVSAPEQQWWRADPDTNFVAAATAKSQALEQERRNLLTSLLGPDWEKTTAAQERLLVALNGPVLGEMSPETKKAVQEILGRFQERAQAYASARQADGKAPDPVELARMKQQVAVELAKVMNPAQLEEFMLRYSTAAGALRRKLRGYDVSPDEFRAIYKLRQPLDDELSLLAADDPATAAKRADLQKRLDDTLKNVLPADRYQQYQLATDPAYQTAVTLVKQAGAPESAVKGLYELNKATQDERTKIQNDDTLTADEKAAKLKAIDDQALAAGNQILGIAPIQTPPLPPDLVPPVTRVHSFSPGETVDQIASRYGVTPSSIFAANPDLNFNVLSPGTPIRIQIPQGK